MHVMKIEHFMLFHVTFISTLLVKCEFRGKCNNNFENLFKHRERERNSELKKDCLESLIKLKLSNCIAQSIKFNNFLLFLFIFSKSDAQSMPLLKGYNAQ